MTRNDRPTAGYYSTGPASLVLTVAAALAVLALIIVAGNEGPPPSSTTSTVAAVLPAEVSARRNAPVAEVSSSTTVALSAEVAVQATGTPPPGAPVPVAPSPSAVRAVASAWTPAQECSRIRNPGPVYLNRDTLSRCAKIAYYLDLGERKGLWVWRGGDLHRLLLLVECESNGRGDNLFQFIRSTWNTEAPRAARALGFSNPTRSMTFDNIAAGVWLYKTDGPGHWSNCSGFAQTTKGRAVAHTLRNMGYEPPTTRWW